MKVLYIQPGAGVGGSKISLYHILKCAPGEQVSQVALSAPREPGYEEKISRYVEKIYYLELPTWNKFRRTSLLEKVKAPFSHLRRLLSLLPAVYVLAQIIKEEKIDLVHTNNGMCPAGALASKLTKRPHVWHIREPIGTSGQYPLIPGDRFSAFLINMLSDVIICNSRYTAAFLRQFGYAVRIIENGLDLALFQRRYHQDDQGCHTSGNGKLPVVAMVGNLTTQWKNHKLFIEMADQLNKSALECRFVVYGSNTNLDLTAYTRELKRRVEHSQLGDRICFAKFMSDIPAMMHSIDVLVHPAAVEGSGRVVMEAMAAGKAVVGVNAGGVRELIQDGMTGYLVSPGDTSSMVEKIRLLLEHPQQMTHMGMRAREYAHQNFSDQAMMSSIVATYKDLIRVSSKYAIADN